MIPVDIRGLVEEGDQDSDLLIQEPDSGWVHFAAIDDVPLRSATLPRRSRRTGRASVSASPRGVGNLFRCLEKKISKFAQGCMT